MAFRPQGNGIISQSTFVFENNQKKKQNPRSKTKTNKKKVGLHLE